jgi:hypothetical protein
MIGLISYIVLKQLYELWDLDYGKKYIEKKKKRNIKLKLSL